MLQLLFHFLPENCEYAEYCFSYPSLLWCPALAMVRQGSPWSNVISKGETPKRTTSDQSCRQKRNCSEPQAQLSKLDQSLAIFPPVWTFESTNCKSNMAAPRWRNRRVLCVISGFRREVDGNRALLGYYAAISGSFLPTFRENLSVPSSRVKYFCFLIKPIKRKLSEFGVFINL